MSIHEESISKVEEIINKSKNAFFFQYKCSIIASTLSDNLIKMKQLQISDDKQEKVSKLNVYLFKLSEKIDQIQDKNVFWIYLNRKKAIQKIINDINKYMKEINSSLRSLDVKDPAKLPTDNLFDDYAKIDDYLSNIQLLVDERRKEVGEYLKQNHSQFTEPLFDSIDLQNTNELDQHPLKKVKKSDFKQAPTFSYENKVFKYYLGKDLRNNNNVTILKLKSDYKRIFKRLISVLVRIDHPCVESFIGSYIENSQVTIITNRYGPPLSNYLSQQTNEYKYEFTPGDRTILAYKIAEGMAYLHSRRIIHRNLITSNIYILPSDQNDTEIKPIVAGFRDSRFLKPGSSLGLSSKGFDKNDYMYYPFIAPEQDDNHTYDEKVDVFAFSGILFELLTNTKPYNSENPVTIKNKLKDKERPIIPDGTPGNLANLIKDCWKHDPKERLSFDQIVDRMRKEDDYIIFPSDIPNKDKVIQFYNKKRIKCCTTKTCIENFELIKQDIGKAYQYRFELLRARPILHNYQYLLRESEYAKDESLDSEIDEKMTSLNEILDNFYAVVCDLFEDEFSSKIEIMKVGDVTYKITKYMESIYKSMTDFGFKNITKYEEDPEDLIFDYRELENFFNERDSGHKNFSTNQSSFSFKNKIEEVKEFRQQKNLNDSKSQKALRERIRDVFSPFQSYELKCEDYTILKNENPKKTAISEVYKGKDRNGKFVAIKKIKEEHLKRGENQLIFLRREIGYLTRLKHKYIAKFIGYALPKDKNEVWFISKFYSDGTLHHRLRTNNELLKLDNDDKTKIAFKIAEVMNYLHSQRILHLDLKSNNILMKGKTPKIIDFGFSCSDNDALKIKSSNIGTYCYMAPEIIRNENYDSKADVFSYGMLLWEIYSEKAPYEDCKDQEEVKEFIVNGVNLEFDKPIQLALKNLIEDCYSNETDKRDSFNKILNKMINSTLMFVGANYDDIFQFYEDKRLRIDLYKQAYNERKILSRGKTSFKLKSDS